jgi:hypothetical protein
MLPRSAYQSIVAYMLYESDMRKSEKLEILEFVESATIEQMLHYLIHDEIVNENETQLVEMGFIMSTALMAAATSLAQAVYSRFSGQGVNACRAMEDSVKRKACQKNYKLRGAAGKISALRKEMGKCSKTANPDKCRKMFQNYIRNAEKQMRGIQTESYIN